MPPILDQRSRELNVISHQRVRELPREEFRRIRATLLQRSRHGMGNPVVMGALGALYLGMAAWMFSTGAPPGVFWPMLLLAIFMCVFAAIHHRRLPKCDVTYLRDALLDCSRCPSCAYDLRALPQEPDGCRVCPECGGAWSLTQRPPEPPTGMYVLGQALSAAPPAQPSDRLTLAYRLGRALRRISHRSD